ncbi:MAG: cell division protein ZapB [Treponemataceae bacterium]|nr:cell division protein ZapB [Treponemataceae bacterium]
MISVEQIYLLQKKVESAVLKIEQLKSENDALRTKCSELTNALSEKTELLSGFMADEKAIESGIMSALSRLDSVENALLDNAMQNSVQGAPSQVQEQFSEAQIASEAAGENQAPQDSVPQVQEGANQENTVALENDGFEFGAGAEEQDSLFGDTSFETDDENPPQEIF